MPEKPSNQTASITINGTAKVGETLSATVTDANGVPNGIVYQWFADGVSILGANAETYVLEVFEVGKAITVKATFTDNDGYAELATSAASVAVEALPPVAVTPIRFKTTNLKGTIEYPLQITLSASNEDSWELIESGIKIADSSGFLASGVSSTTSTDSWQMGATILTLATAGANKNYELAAKNRKCTLSHSMVSAGTDGTVIVENFSIDTPLLQLQLANTYLTVPNTLPSYMTDLSLMFYSCDLFNQDLSGWNTSNVTNMLGLFQGCKSFNQNIGGWNTSNVTNMASLFLGCTIFNQNISGWDTSKVTSFDGIFRDTGAFNQPIGVWNTSNVTTMRTAFNRANAFNSSINNWDTSKVTDMSWMFQVSPKFNLPLNLWNTANVINMEYMFSDAKAFNQDLSQWCVGKITSQPNQFDTSTAYSWTLRRPVWGTCPRGENLAA